MAKPKVIRKPLVDINGRNVFTWEKVDTTQQNKELSTKAFDRFLQVRDRIRATEKNGLVLVEGLGLVPSF